MDSPRGKNSALNIFYKHEKSISRKMLGARLGCVAVILCLFRLTTQSPPGYGMFVLNILLSLFV